MATPAADGSKAETPDGTSTAAPAEPGSKVLRIRNKGLVKLRPSDVLENPANFQQHPAEQHAALRGTVDRLGWYGYPDVFQLPDGRWMLVDGALRRSELIAQYGDEPIDFNHTDFTEAEAELALATKDPLAKMATVNGKILEELLARVTPDAAPELEYLFGRLRDQSFEATMEAISQQPTIAEPGGDAGNGGSVPDEALGKSFVNLSAPCTKEQHALILDAVNHAKTTKRLSTTAEALAFICSEFMAPTKSPKRKGSK